MQHGVHGWSWPRQGCTEEPGKDPSAPQEQQGPHHHAAVSSNLDERWVGEVPGLLTLGAKLGVWEAGQRRCMMPLGQRVPERGLAHTHTAPIQTLARKLPSAPLRSCTRRLPVSACRGMAGKAVRLLSGMPTPTCCVSGERHSYQVAGHPVHPAPLIPWFL